MKNEDTKKVLVDLRRQIEGLNYYLSDLKIIENDRKSKQQLYHAQQTAKELDNRIGMNLRTLDNDIREERTAEIDESLRVSLGSINSPTETMRRDTKFNMKIRQSGFGGRNILKEASDNFLKMIRTAAGKEGTNEKRAARDEKDSK